MTRHGDGAVPALSDRAGRRLLRRTPRWVKTGREELALAALGLQAAALRIPRALPRAEGPIRAAETSGRSLPGSDDRYESRDRRGFDIDELGCG